MSEPVPYLDLKAQLKPLRAEIDAAIARTLDNCSFCLGPDVVQFEKDFAAFCGAQHALGFNSGTSALHVAMLLLGVGPGDEVITTPYTFIATSWAISYCGAKPVYVDIDEDTLQKIAGMTGGKYYRADNADKFRQIYAEIDKLEKTEATVNKFTEYKELFGWFVGAGLALLLLELVLGETIFRRLP